MIAVASERPRDRGPAPAAAAAIDALCQFEGLDHCRFNRGLSVEETTACLGDALHLLLDPSAGRTPNG